MVSSGISAGRSNAGSRHGLGHHWSQCVLEWEFVCGSHCALCFLHAVWVAGRVQVSVQEQLPQGWGCVMWGMSGRTLAPPPRTPPDPHIPVPAHQPHPTHTQTRDPAMQHQRPAARGMGEGSPATTHLGPPLPCPHIPHTTSKPQLASQPASHTTAPHNPNITYSLPPHPGQG